MPSWLPIEQYMVINWATSLIRAFCQSSIIFLLVRIFLAFFPGTHPALCGWLWRIVYLKLLVSFWVTPAYIPWMFSMKNLTAPVTRLFETNSVSRWIPDFQNITNRVETDLMVFSNINFFFIIWLLGIGFSGLLIILLWFYNRNQTKDNFPVSDSKLTSMYSVLCNQIKVKYPPRLFFSDTISSPSLQGLIRPRIIFPAAVFSQYRLDEIKYILAHELAHYKRGDLFWNWLPIVGRVLFFFHPVVWIAEREWKQLNEICCDRLAVRFTGAKAADFGQVLLKAAIQPRLNVKGRLAEFFASRSNQILKKRLLSLNDSTNISPKRLLASGALIIFFGLVLVLPWRFPPALFFAITHSTYDTQHFYKLPLRSLMISGRPYDHDKISIRSFNVTIDGQEIAPGITFNSYGVCTYRSFSGYLLTKKFDLYSPHRIEVTINTTVGDFSEKFLVDFRENEICTNYLF